MNHKTNNGLNNNGFTLVELLIAVAISGFILAAVYMTYRSQQKSYVVQEKVATMQQNIRSAMYYMEREIRMAGFDPTGNADAKIETANANSIRFTMDVTGGQNDGIDNDNDGIVDEDTDGIDNNGDGVIDRGTEADEFRFSDGNLDDSNEDISYSLYISDGIKKLGRKSSSTANNQPIAEYIDALNFVYLDEDGNVVASIPEIRSIQITLIARAPEGDKSFVNNKKYYNQQDTCILDLSSSPDNIRRRILTTTVKCRNLGL